MLPLVWSNRMFMCSECRHGAEKLLGFLITVGQAVAYVVAGMYGEVRELGAGVAILIVLQVCSFLPLRNLRGEVPDAWRFTGSPG